MPVPLGYTLATSTSSSAMQYIKIFFPDSTGAGDRSTGTVAPIITPAFGAYGAEGLVNIGSYAHGLGLLWLGNDIYNIYRWNYYAPLAVDDMVLSETDGTTTISLMSGDSSYYQDPEGDVPEPTYVIAYGPKYTTDPTTVYIYNDGTALRFANDLAAPDNGFGVGAPPPEGPICYIGKSNVLTKDIATGIESQVCVEDITPEKYLVFSSTQNKFVPVRVNCISGENEKFILIKKDLLYENKPSEDFYVTPRHPILYKNCEIEAKNIIGATRVTLDKQKIYTLVTDNREALTINNIDVMCWEYESFMRRYTKSKNAVWIENENMRVIPKF